MERDLQHNKVRQLDRVLGPGAIASSPLLMLLEGILQVSREDVNIDDVLCAVEGQDKQVQGGWGHGGQALLYCKEDGGVSGDVNGAEGTVVKGQGPLRAVIGGPRPECGL